MATDGLCECGCGQKTRLAPCSDRNKGWVRGEPIRFIRDHYIRGRGQKAPAWRGGGSNNHGYRITRISPETELAIYNREHVVIAERVLGKKLPPKAIVHHVNKNQRDNRNCNLVICENQDYHKTLHKRMRAQEACGNPDWIPCAICHKYDDPQNMRSRKMQKQRPIYYHPECVQAYDRARWPKRSKKNGADSIKEDSKAS